MVKSIGLDDFIKEMDPKLKKLYQNILTVFIILMILYAVATIVMMVFLEGKSFMDWFASSHFVTSVVVIVIVVVCNSLLSGKELVVPEEFKSKKGKKTDFNIPDTWGVKGQIKKKQKPKQKPKLSSTPKGSWRCPYCDTLVVGRTCPSCGYRR